MVSEVVEEEGGLRYFWKEPRDDSRLGLGTLRRKSEKECRLGQDKILFKIELNYSR